ncbi:MAG: hypothetical protein EOO40_03295 [Deltaproteobacteria bacterium]|nr:MAG: hypothetical protein EOO40_03295 [Deltaproteobacteria bacterium]
MAHLKEAVESLRAARRERAKWGLITAGEEVRRITRKSLRACCLVAMRLLNVADAQKHFTSDVSDLQAGLWTRAALMAFAHDMQALSQVGAGIDGVDLGMHMRDIRIRMLQLSGDTHYSELRAPDRYQLQLLFGEISHWLDHSWEDFSRARALLTQATTLASHLSQINSRDLLVAHDKEVHALAQSKLQALLAGPAGDRDGERAWRGLADALDVLTRMRWRDQALDAVVQAQLHGLKPAASDRTAPNTAGGQGRGVPVEKARRDAAALHIQAKQLQATLAAVSFG